MTRTYAHTWYDITPIQGTGIKLISYLSGEQQYSCCTYVRTTRQVLHRTGGGNALLHAAQALYALPLVFTA